MPLLVRPKNRRRVHSWGGTIAEGLMSCSGELSSPAVTRNVIRVVTARRDQSVYSSSRRIASYIPHSTSGWVTMMRKGKVSSRPSMSSRPRLNLNLVCECIVKSDASERVNREEPLACPVLPHHDSHPYISGGEGGGLYLRLSMWEVERGLD